MAAAYGWADGTLNKCAQPGGQVEADCIPPPPFHQAMHPSLVGQCLFLIQRRLSPASFVTSLPLYQTC